MQILASIRFNALRLGVQGSRASNRCLTEANRLHLTHSASFEKIKKI
jgi:hypothetical protein